MQKNRRGLWGHAGWRMGTSSSLASTISGRLDSPRQGQASSMTVNSEPSTAWQIGALYRTRDRREARIERIDAGSGLIFGQVQMHGRCVWRAGGRYRDAPFGAPGPLDLVPPSEIVAAKPQTASTKEASQANYRPFCCD